MSDAQRFRVSGKGIGIFWTVLKRSDEFLPWQTSSVLLSSPTSNTKRVFPSALLVHGAAVSQPSLSVQPANTSQPAPFGPQDPGLG